MKIQQHSRGRMRKTMQLTRERKEKMVAIKLLMKMVMMSSIAKKRCSCCDDGDRRGDADGEKRS